MRTFILTLIALVNVSLSFGQHQIRGRVYDQESKEPLPFVNIVVNDSRTGTTSDLDGYFYLQLSQAPVQLSFSYIGYKPLKLDSTSLSSLNLSAIEVQMTRSNEVLQQIDLVAKENPAHRIIRAAVANRDAHTPENYPSFKYKSYNKFILTMDPDSVTIPDTLMTREDSLKSQMMDFLDTKHIFITESVSERKFKDANNDSEEVLATRVSGFQNPTFAVLATEFQSLSFYKDYISVMGQEFLSPISKGSTKRYFFMLKDTIYQGADSIFVIQFEPRRKTNFDGLKGAVYITTDGFALTNVLAEPAKKQKMEVKVQQHYKKVNGGYWFPYRLNADFKFSTVEMNGIPPIGMSRSYLKDIEVGVDFEKKEISKANVVIVDEATKRDQFYWQEHRGDTLSPKEEETYIFIDSLGKAENLEAKLKLFQAMVSGKWPIGVIDIDLPRIMDYNNYEGYRLGLGLHTNKKLISWMSIGGYGAYGFKDKKWKYGGDIDFSIADHLRWHAGYGYSFDVPESGKSPLNSGMSNPFGMSDIRNYYVDQNRDWLETHQWYTEMDVLVNLKARLSFNKERFERIESYEYLAEDWIDAPETETFHFSNIRLDMVYKPNERVMKTPDGLTALNYSYPIYNLRIEKGFKNIWESQFSYWSAHFRLDQEWKIRNLGDFHLQFTTGKVFGKVAYPKLITAPGNNSGKFSIASPYSFETMGIAEFAATEYAFIQLSHDFGKLLINKKWFHPAIKVIQNMGYGSFRGQEEHAIDRRAMDKGYFETGLELNRLVSWLGIGGYFRYGFYSKPEPWDNLSLKMTFSMAF